MKRIELLKLTGIVIFLPVFIWMATIRGTVRDWNDYRKAKAEFALCDTIRQVKEEDKIKPSLMDFISSKEVKLLKYNRYTGEEKVIINELIVTGDFLKQVMLIDRLSDHWDLSSLTVTAETTTIIIQEVVL